MSKFKKVLFRLLYPHPIITTILVIILIPSLIWSMISLGTKHIVSIIIYVLSVYTLLLLCLKTPKIIKTINRIKQDNKYISKMINDVHFRMKFNLFISLGINVIYAVLQFFIGLRHNSFWFYSMAIYYLILVIIRWILIRPIINYGENENIKKELLKYRFCGWMMLFLNISLTAILFFMIYWNRSFNHHEITTIALAAYTFTSFTIAITSFIKYRKNSRPIYKAIKTINLVSACVSVITLEATMLTTFGNDMSLTDRRLFIGLTGLFVILFIFLLAINIILNTNTKIKELKDIENKNTNQN